MDTPTLHSKKTHIIKNMLLSEIQAFLSEEHCDRIKCFFDKKDDDNKINDNIQRLLDKYTK